jgi:hypothetical protein
MTGLLGAAVVLLALAALLIPRTSRERGDGYLLVIDPAGAGRRDSLYEPLANWLSQATPRRLRLRLASSPEAVTAREWKDVDVVICPDGVALGLGGAAFRSVAAVRRPGPDEQRSRSVLVYRRVAGLQARPWQDAPARTLLGDSLSLAGCGVVCPRGRRGGRAGPAWPSGLRCGPDPYDHEPVLHALRLGAGDYAVVRELAARRFLAAGLLDPLVWGVEELSPVLPDSSAAAGGWSSSGGGGRPSVVTRRPSWRAWMSWGWPDSTFCRNPLSCSCAAGMIIAGPPLRFRAY